MREKSASEATTPHPWTEFVESQDASLSGMDDSQAPDSADAGTTPATPAFGEDDGDEKDDEKEESVGFSREAEIEKLRTGGSMTQNPHEIARIRNISKVQFGKNDLFPWYFSPYPEVFTQEDVIYICEF